MPTSVHVHYEHCEQLLQVKVALHFPSLYHTVHELPCGIDRDSCSVSAVDLYVLCRSLAANTFPASEEGRGDKMKGKEGAKEIDAKRK